MKKLTVFALFFAVNFGALAIGRAFMGSSPMDNSWYNGLIQAPWTPPGFVFGIAWTLIMLCFSIYLTLSPVFVFSERKRRSTYVIHLI